MNKISLLCLPPRPVRWTLALLSLALGLQTAAGGALFEARLTSPWYERLPDPDPLSIPPSPFLPFEWNQALNTAAEALNPRLRLGLRYRQVTLLDNKRSLENSFLGSIVELQSQSDFSALSWLFLEWRFNPIVALRLGMEQARAKTVTGNQIVHSDGILNIQGPALSLLLRYPNSTRLTPAGQIGAVYYAASFEHDPIWHNGFGGESREENYARWVAAGQPAWPNGGYRRSLVPENTYGLLLGTSLECQLLRRLNLLLFLDYAVVKKVDISFELSRYGNVFQRENTAFPMSYLSAGAGLSWSF